MRFKKFKISEFLLKRLTFRVRKVAGFEQDDQSIRQGSLDYLCLPQLAIKHKHNMKILSPVHNPRTKTNKIP